MAAPDFTTVSQGQINQSGSATALFLKVFSGEVLTTFGLETVTMDRHRVRTIASGKSAQFPVLGSLTQSYHTAGTTITGQAANQNEKVINIDSLMIAPWFNANIDEAMSHYDIRQPYAIESGRALAREFDKNVLATTILAARASANLSSDALSYGGKVITDANAGSVADNLAADILTAAQTLDEKNVPAADRFCYLRPAYYYLLLNGSKTINRDYNWDQSNGSYGTGKVYEVSGIPVIKSNNVPNAVISSATGQNNTYSGTFTTTVAVVSHKEAVGTVKLMDISTESSYLIQNQGYLTVSKMAVGHGILRPEAAVEIKTS